jgi:hypothetical protein
MTEFLALLFAMVIGGGAGASYAQDSPQEVSKGAAASATPAPWQLKLRISGGIAGLDQQLELASTGDLKAIDRRRGIEVSARASASDTTQIASLIAGVESVDPAPRRARTACSDCLQYDLDLRIDGRSLAFSLNDVTLAGTAIEPLVHALLKLLNRELSQQRTPREPIPDVAFLVSHPSNLVTVDGS